MVSLEDEMKQKDKEAAVLKANHKYEILLNIELERIEKCKRTYEHFHNFEVAVMKDRQNRILQKQYELQVQKNSTKFDTSNIEQRWQCSKSQPINRTNAPYFSSNNCTERNSEKKNVSKCLKQSKYNSNYKVMPLLNERNSQTNLRGAQYANNVQYVNSARTRADLPITRVTNQANSVRFCRNNNTTNWETANSSLVEAAVKFPILQSVSSVGKSAMTANSTTTSTVHPRHPNFAEDLSKTRVIQSSDFPTPRTVSRRRKKSYRTANEDNLSPFDQYRLRLQESEQRVRKPKHHYARAISAMESNTNRNYILEDTLTAVRRARSADAQLDLSI